MLSTRAQRFFFVTMPLIVATGLIAVLFAVASTNWSDARTFWISLIVAIIWAAFVAAPLLILVAPAKSE